MTIRRILKKGISTFLLAPYYYLCCLRPVQHNLVVFADGHQDHMPYSMQAIFGKIKRMPDMEVIEYFQNYSFCSPLQALKNMLGFIPLYARAKYVFLCDCYIPATCCRKRSETILVQLWHSCGLMKKVGKDSPSDSAGMLNSQFRNTDMFTTSAPIVSDVLSQALMIPRDKFSNVGVTRMDLMYNEQRTHALYRQFLEQYPMYRGKKIILWAPTFRGNARNGYLEGAEDILRLQKELPDDYAVIIKTHRFSGRTDLNTQVRVSAERILPFADILITDYSSIYYDYLYFRRPVILYVPDLTTYEKDCGLYMDIEQMPGYISRTYDEMKYAVLHTEEWVTDSYRQAQDALWNKQMIACDGHSCDKLLEELGMVRGTTKV